MKRASLSVLCLAILFLGAVWCYLCLIHPRPYWVTEIDLEQDYLYNAKLIHSGLPVAGIHHPGTPVHLLGALLLRLSGDGLMKTQRFFDMAYFVIFLSTAAAVSYFAIAALRSSPAGFVLLSLATLMAWPPFFFHMNYFGADSFVVPVGLPTVTLFWRALERDAPADRWLLFLCGLGVGVCLAVKMSFLPLVVALMAGGAVHVWRSVRAAPRAGDHPSRLAAFAAAMPLGAALSYLLSTLPIFRRIPRVWLNTFDRSDARPPDGLSLASLSTTLNDVFRFNPPLALVWLGILTALLWTLGRFELRRTGSAKPVLAGSQSEKFDRVAAGVFVSIGLAGFVFTLMVAAGDWAPVVGSRLRNAYPSAIVLPFVVLFLGRGRKQGAPAFHGLLSQVLLGAAGGLAVAWGLVCEVAARDALIQEHVVRAQATRLRLEQLAPGPGRVAFWTRYLDHLGDVGFHFWGNYRYAFSQFDEPLLDAFPRYTLLRLRDVGPPFARAVRGPSRFGRLGDEARKLRKWLTQAPDPYPRRRSVVTGVDAGVRVALAAFPENELGELRGVDEAQVRAPLEARWGPARVWTEGIAGTEWRLIAMEADGRKR